MLALALSLVLSQPLVLEGTLSGAGDFEMISFEVPAGIKEIHVAHSSQAAANILDYGLWSPSGFRGYGGGNSEPFAVAETGATRSYLPGAIEPGTWQVMIGKAKVVTSPAPYRLEIELRAEQTLPAHSRTQFVSPVLSNEARWYAGDFHVHSHQSGDAAPTLEETAAFAASRGLDFIHLAEHNTNAGVGLLGATQAGQPSLLLIPGVEFTTYGGHANGIGAVSYVDHRIGYEGQTVAKAFTALRAQGAVVSINHPRLDLDICIGCAWEHEVPDTVNAVEIGTGGWDKTGLFFGEATFAWWERLVSLGHKLAPVGGSDDHRAGQGTGAFDSPIGNPTTLVYAQELSVAGIVEGVKRGRTVVKLQGPADPFVEFKIGAGLPGDEVVTEHGGAELTAVVTGGEGSTLVIFRDGEELSREAVTADPFEYEAQVQAGRYRAVVEVDGAPRTVTNNIWLAVASPPPENECGCGAGQGVLALLALAWLARRQAAAGS